MNYYIKNATLVNEGQTFVASVFVSDGKIAKIVKDGEVGPSTSSGLTLSLIILAIFPSERNTSAINIWPSLTSVAFFMQ